MSIYEFASEFNSELKNILSLFPLLFVIVFDSLIIIGGIVALCEFIGEWWKKVRNG